MFHFQSPENNSIFFCLFLWDDFIARFLDSFVHHFCFGEMISLLIMFLGFLLDQHF